MKKGKWFFSFKGFEAKGHGPQQDRFRVELPAQIACLLVMVGGIGAIIAVACGWFPAK